MIMKHILYLAKEPGKGVRDDLSRLSGKEVTVVDCLGAYGDYYRKMGYNVISKTKYFELDGTMRFDYVIGNPPYDDGMYIKFMKQLPNILKEDGVFKILIPNKLLTPFSKGATFSKDNLSIESIDQTCGAAFVESIEGTWVCKVTGKLGKTKDKFPMILPGGEVVETDFDSPNPVMEMSPADFTIHQKVMRKDNKFITHKKGEISNDYFVYIRPTAKRVNNKLRYHGVANQWVEGLENGIYQVCDSADQAETMLKIYTESELFRYISYCNFGFTLINRFIKEYLPNIENCSYNSEQDVYDFFSVSDEEIEHIRNILAKKRNKHH